MLQIISVSLPTYQVISISPCLLSSPITYHMETFVNGLGLSSPKPARMLSFCGSSWLKANGYSLLHLRGAHFLSKVPSIWRVPQSHSVAYLRCQASTGGMALPGRGRLFVLC